MKYTVGQTSEPKTVVVLAVFERTDDEDDRGAIKQSDMRGREWGARSSLRSQAPQPFTCALITVREAPIAPPSAAAALFAAHYSPAYQQNTALIAAVISLDNPHP